ncbi:MAG: large-conductance mechanosensitive channel protein MscL [Oscillospiraceae bacterium]|nr:large-conductance mechanosensitive channel protein MscL [Oscillospiraceae bacterium]
MAEKSKGFIKEFKEFAVSGNMFDMAIGIIIGGVFKDLVASFTTNVIMPIISIFTGGVDFNEWKLQLPTLLEKTDPETGEKLVNYLNYGTFVSAVISFLILMLVVFIMVRSMNKLREKMKKNQDEEAAPAAPEPSAEEKLLIEIRDLLAKK